MPDREKVIKGLECCASMNGGACRECPYSSECVASEVLYQTGTAHLAADALALLKEQEPIPCGEKIKAGDVVLDFYECGYCKNAIRKPWRYCPFCGKAVKWR